MNGIALGPDGNVWFTRSDSAVGRITPAGVASRLALPTNVSEIATGPDGNLWVTSFGSTAGMIGRITPLGVITTFMIPSGNVPNHIAAGPDGNLWFTELLGNKIGRIQIPR